MKIFDMLKKHNEAKKIALVLGSGAARGVAHIGALKVITREAIPIDLVVGTSVGSLIGASFALELNASQAEKVALKMSWRDIMGITMSKMGLSSGDNLEKVIASSLLHKGFDDLKIPFAAVTTDIETGEDVVHTSGNLVRVIRASCSMAGIYSPVRIDNRLLVDGGYNHTVPTSIARQLGADFIIAVDVGYCIKKGKVSNIFQVIIQAYQIQGQRLGEYQAMDADILMRPDLGEIDQMAFDRGAELIQKGEAAAEAVLPEIIKKLKSFGRM